MPTGMCSLFDKSDILLGLFSFYGTPDLLLYSFIPMLIVFLLVLIMFRNSKKFDSFKGIIAGLFLMEFLYLFLWTVLSNKGVYILWHFIIPIYIIQYYFFFKFAKDITGFPGSKIVSHVVNAILLIFLIFSFTKLNTPSYNYDICTGVDGILWKLFYIPRLLIVFLICYFFEKKILVEKSVRYIVLWGGVLVGLLIDIFADIYADASLSPTTDMISSQYIYGVDVFRVVGHLSLVIAYLYFIYSRINKERSYHYLKSFLLVSVGVISFGSFFLITKEKYHFLLYGSLAVNILLVIYLIYKELKLEKLENKVHKLVSEQQEVSDELASKLNLPEVKDGESSRLRNLIKMVSSKDGDNQITSSCMKFTEAFSFLHSYTDSVQGYTELEHVELYCDKNILENSFGELLSKESIVSFDYNREQKKITFTIEKSNIEKSNFHNVKEGLRFITISIERNDNGSITGIIKTI